MKVYSVPLPVDWEPQEQPVELTSISPASQTWTSISQGVQQCLKVTEVLRIERIQNQSLWERYVIAKEMMMAKNRGEINELLLYHGTSSTPPPSQQNSIHLNLELTSDIRKPIDYGGEVPTSVQVLHTLICMHL